MQLYFHIHTSSSKTKKFKAGEIEKAQFTLLNEHFEIEAQRRSSKVLKDDTSRDF